MFLRALVCILVMISLSLSLSLLTLVFQVNQNLRSFGNLTRIDVQCMMYNHSDGLPETIRSGLNNKVDDLLKVSLCILGSACTA